MLSKFREPVNGLTHLAGAILAFFGLFVLLFAGRGGVAKNVSVLVYGLGLIGMFSASAAYHLARVKPAILQVLRKIDHSSIFVLIAGTYTPFCLMALTGFWHWGLLAIIWTIALVGIAVKIFYIKAPRWLNVAVYIVMGWLCLLAVPQMLALLPPGALVWLITGGVLYTLGAIIYATRIFDFKPGIFGFHEVWHIFVLLGASAHYISVLYLLLS
jgi:hemolysin III